MIPVLPEVCLCRNVVAPENFSRIFSQKWTAAIYANDFFEESSAKNVRRSRWRISWPRESSPATKKLQPENVRKSLWQWIQNEMKKSRNQKKKHAHEIQCLAQSHIIHIIPMENGNVSLRKKSWC